MKRMKYCPKCKKYTLEETCSCGGATVVRIPPRYSPIDKTAKYRRLARKEDLQKRGLL
jgi:rRNA maturation protein Nop10